MVTVLSSKGTLEKNPSSFMDVTCIQAKDLHDFQPLALTHPHNYW
jgi:hypothetical protein